MIRRSRSLLSLAALALFVSGATTASAQSPLQATDVDDVPSLASDAVPAVAKTPAVANEPGIDASQRLSPFSLPSIDAPIVDAAMAELVPSSPRYLNRPVGVSDAPDARMVTRVASRSSHLAVVVTSPFGVRDDPFTGLPRMHAGVDLRAPIGTTVGASDAGTIVFAGERGGYGNCVVVDHGFGVLSYYGHLSATLVTPGQRVCAGQCLGRVGSTGRSTGPHLHYELREAGRPVNPFGPVTAFAASRTAELASAKSAPAAKASEKPAPSATATDAKPAASAFEDFYSVD